MKLGIVGATGLVGQNFLRLLEKEPASFVEDLQLFSRHSKECLFKGRPMKTKTLFPGVFKGLDVCFFSAGEEVSRRFAPQAVEEGAVVIDNSSAFRSDPDKLLVVPEINGSLLELRPQIISNPNCSTIPLVLALHSLEHSFGLKSVHVVTLQSISGAGRQALEDLKRESLEILQDQKPYEQKELSYAFNCVPYIGESDESGFCREEQKIMNESQKILNRPDLPVSAFTIRVPCWNSHSEVVRFSLEKQPSSKEDLHKALQPYIKVTDPPPHARQASGCGEVFAGRIHKDSIGENSWLMWLVTDNLLKGASLNGLDIAKHLDHLLSPKA